MVRWSVVVRGPSPEILSRHERPRVHAGISPRPTAPRRYYKFTTVYHYRHAGVSGGSPGYCASGDAISRVPEVPDLDKAGDAAGQRPRCGGCDPPPRTPNLPEGGGGGGGGDGRRDRAARPRENRRLLGPPTRPRRRILEALGGLALPARPANLTQGLTPCSWTWPMLPTRLPTPVGASEDQIPVDPS